MVDDCNPDFISVTSSGYVHRKCWHHLGYRKRNGLAVPASECPSQASPGSRAWSRRTTRCQRHPVNTDPPSASGLYQQIQPQRPKALRAGRQILNASATVQYRWTKFSRRSAKLLRGSDYHCPARGTPYGSKAGPLNLDCPGLRNCGWGRGDDIGDADEPLRTLNEARMASSIGESRFPSWYTF